MTEKPYPRRVASMNDHILDTEKEKEEVARLRSSLGKMKVVSRAKVTHNRIYSTAYHPEKSKDLVFFGGEHNLA